MSGVYTIAKAALILIPAFALTAAPKVVPNKVDQSAANAATDPMAAPALLQMSTGEEQSLVAEGDSAFARNARIPLSGKAISSLAEFEPIRPQSAHYKSALKCLAQAVYYEAANEPKSGKQAVAQVVVNRLRHPSSPNSICGVVYQGVNAKVCQFSFTCDGALTRVPMPQQWSESLSVAKRALAGDSYRPVGTATHYHADYVVPKWAYTLSKLKVVGRHIFYRFPGQAGEPANFSARWANAERVPTIDFSRFGSSGDRVKYDLDAPSENWVPGLTVEPDPADRHAANDVGGRIDTTKEWRLSIPDPVASKGRYDSAVAEQSDVIEPGDDQTGPDAELEPSS